MVLAPLATIALARPGFLPRVVLDRVWKKDEYIDVYGSSDLAKGTIATSKGTLSLADGSLKKTETSASETSVRSLPAFGFRQPDERAWHEIGTTPASSVVYRTAPRPQFAELSLGDGKVLRALDLASGFGDTFLTVDPLMRWVRVSSSIVHTGRDTEVDELLLLPLARSPLPFVRYWDLSKAPALALGVPLPKGVTFDRAPRIPYTPDLPLCCGSPKTGKIVWTNPAHGVGRWLGSRYVLAAFPWAVLDASTGKELESNAYQELQGAGSADVRVVGRYVLANRHSTDGGLETVCFRVRP